MTEQVNETQNTQQDAQGINISIEQILAAVVNHMGTITVPIDKLIMDYANKQIAVNQNEDKSIAFSLVDAPTEKVESAEEESEKTDAE